MYNYKEALKEDVKDWLEDNKKELSEKAIEWEYDNDAVYEWAYDLCWTADCVTGNGSGSYTFSTYKARCNVFEDIDSDEYIHDMIQEGFMSEKELGEAVAYSEWEKIDVCIRCYLLGQVLQDVLEKMDF